MKNNPEGKKKYKPRGEKTIEYLMRVSILTCFHFVVFPSLSYNYQHSNLSIK